MSRRTARESLIKLVYERIINGEKNALTFNLLSSAVNEIQQEYLNSVYIGIDEKYDFLISVVDRYSVDFNIDRVYKVDLSILLVSIYEILFRIDVPDLASINEALELAKIYSTEKSSQYINGILASVIRFKEELLDECKNN